MPRLPRLRGREVARVLGLLGWTIARQSGSHIILVKDGHSASLSVPDHREVAQGTLRGLLRAADLTVAEFVDASRR